MSIPNFNRVQSYCDISSMQLLQLRSQTERLVSLSFNINLFNNQEEVLEWKKTVETLHQKNFFDRSSPFRLVLNIVTLQFIKGIILKCLLPSIMRRVDIVAQSILHIRAQDAPQPLDVSRTLIEQQLKTARKAHQWFLNNQQNFPGVLVPSLKQEINDYFQTTINKLSGGNFVPLPTWYHATGKSEEQLRGESRAITIIQSGKIQLSGEFAALQSGVYVSTEDEFYGGYGNYTFALDRHVIDPKPGLYIRGLNMGGSKERVWLCVAREIPIKPHSVAYIAVENQLVKETLKRRFPDAFECPVLTRRASDWIRESFQRSRGVYQLPGHWRRGYPLALEIPLIKEAIV